MEKLLYSLWKLDNEDVDAFRDGLLAGPVPALVATVAVRGLRLCIADTAVAAAAGRRIESHPPVADAVLALWVDDAGAAPLWEPLFADRVSHYRGYLVAEAEPLVSRHTHPATPGERVDGMCQVVFLDPPEALSRTQWLALWKDSHTRIAIDTQATFGYRQNLVVRTLGADTPWRHAIVEENFPPEAMVDDHAFYGTGGDPVVLQRHREAMLQSCARFIDFDSIDVIPMSEYLLKAPRWD